MAHFAQLDENNIVLQVIVVNNEVIDHLPFPESEMAGVEFCQSLLGPDTIWKQTSYNNNFRKHYAGIGYTYNENLDAFIGPKPFTSWILDETNCVWNAPKPFPNDGNTYYWDENLLEWVLLTYDSEI